MKRILVTGGAGFIGSNVIRFLLGRGGDVSVRNLDALTYAGDAERLKDFEADPRYSFVHGDVSDGMLVDGLFAKGVDIVFHLAAESHVDRSIEDAFPFESTNVRGTVTLLEAARKHGVGRFVHVSTDEVYGDLEESGQFTEETPLNPNSPYSASKAAGDLFARAYRHTYGLPVVIARPSNNYGPWQYPEKLIPVVISRALADRPVPVYAQGLNVREWLYVEDCARGIFEAGEKGVVGEAYNIGSGQERRNIDVVKSILALLGKPESLITFVMDRPGHDFRYSLNSEKVKAHTGWKAATTFDAGIERTVAWYVRNQAWWKKFAG
jgi:dTDP-glucose 4,6-dehydratase